MKDSIIVKCPDCGQWVEIPYKGGAKRFIEGFGSAYDSADKIAKKWGLNSKWRKAVATVASAMSGFTGHALIKGTIDGTFGDAYSGLCPECGHEFSIEDDKLDERDKYDYETNDNSQFFILKNRFNDDDITPDSIESVNEYIENIESYIPLEEDAVHRSDLYDILSLMYWWKDDISSAIDYVYLACEEEVGKNILSPLLQAYYMSQLTWEDKSMQAKYHYQNLVPLLNYKRTEGYLLPFHEYEEAFETCKESYVNNFLSIPPEQRRFLVFSDKFDVFPEQFFVLPIDMIPRNLDIRGNYGVIRENELYIIHPYKPNTYFLVRDYAIGLFRDKVLEFKDIMLSLGAKTLSFSDIQESERNSKRQKSRSVEAGGSLDGKGSIQGNIDDNTTEEQQRKLYDEMKDDGEYALTPSYPALPNRLVWYPHEEKWQMEVKHRLDGRTIKAKYTLSLNSSETISKSKQADIKAGLEALIGEININSSFNEDTFNSMSLLHSWKCSVEFYPLSEYNKE